MLGATNTSQGGWNRQGIFQFAYRDDGDDHEQAYVTQGGRPYDDYYFTDFVCRIHKDDQGERHGNTTPEIKYSFCPDDCRYNDGNYQISAKALTVRNVVHNSGNSQFILDNWKPFIQGVKVLWGLETIYNAYWECTPNSCIKFNENESSTSIIYHPNTPLIIDVTSSEPLPILLLHIPDLGIQSQLPISKNETENETVCFLL